VTLLERLRDHAAFLGAQQVTGEDAGGVYLKQSELVAVLNLIEAAKPLADLPYPHTADERMEWLTYQQKLRAAVAVFVSGQEPGLAFVSWQMKGQP
jgi:hypothetical protein